MSIKLCNRRRSLLAIVGALGLALIVGGCSSGGSSGGGASTLINPSSVEEITVVADPSATRIAFTVVSPDRHSMAVRVEISEDRGATYTALTVESGETEALSADTDGERYEVVWRPATDITQFAQSDLRVRVTPRDEVTGEDGLAAESAPFSLGSNTPPDVVAVATPTTTQGGPIDIDYWVRDVDQDHVGIELEYSVDNGASWSNGTLGSGGDGTSAIATTTLGVQRTVVWNAPADLAGATSSQTRVRLTARDIATGGSSISNAFSIDLRAPTIQGLTVGSIPQSMNGSTSYTVGTDTVDFQLGVPPTGFLLTIDVSPSGSGSPIDPASLSVTADLSAGTGFPAGTELGDRFTFDGNTATWLVDTPGFTVGADVTFTATVADDLGNPSTEETLTVTVVTNGGGQRPFDVLDRWYLNFNSDHFGLSASGSNTISITTTVGGNGIADFEEDLLLLGLRSESPNAAAAAIDTNQLVLDLCKQEVIGRLRELFGRDFDGTTDGFNPNIEFTSTPGGHTSTLRIGGADTGAGLAIGRAQFDHRNSGGNVNDSSILGVFVTNVTEFYVNSSFTFRSRYDALIPGRGTPVGQHTLDGTVLASDFDRLSLSNTTDENDRYDEIWTAIEALGRSTAVIAAHEIGHSIGLCSAGHPPTGHFGGVTEAPFTGTYTTSFHVDTAGNNLMSSALSFGASVNSGPTGYRFNEFNEAYLREWVLIGF